MADNGINEIISPDNGIISPDNGIISPDNGIISPYNGIISPDNGIISPDNGIISPDNGIISPDNGIISPDNGIISPDNGIISPDNGIISPDNGIISPDNGIISPDNGIISPDNGIISPDNGIISPENDIISPDHNDNIGVAHTNQGEISSTIERTYWAPPWSWYNGSLTQEELADLDKLAEEIQIRRIIEIGIQERAGMADMTARGLEDSAIIQQQQERITFLEEQFEQNKKAEAEKEKERLKSMDKWLATKVEEMMAEFMNSQTEATPQDIPIPETPQLQIRFSVPPTGPNIGQHRFTTSTPYTAAHGRDNPETPHPQNMHGGSST
ncbi:hypothetical protein PCASD_26402 [Puccinia coronata f. sp. avenae]|uniref:Uncharacterized protein n=1 Tax=Puccinia coronata f. sp. avenae TaxID=200324 RepID=A0A2N5TKM4_9BASI|nr:hypothetical protein PCASD_26402 [Puccinia coronata f. sp. avenae]